MRTVRLPTLLRSCPSESIPTIPNGSAKSTSRRSKQNSGCPPATSGASRARRLSNESSSSCQRMCFLTPYRCAGMIQIPRTTVTFFGVRQPCLRFYSIAGTTRKSGGTATVLQEFGCPCQRLPVWRCNHRYCERCQEPIATPREGSMI